MNYCIKISVYVENIDLMGYEITIIHQNSTKCVESEIGEIENSERLNEKDIQRTELVIPSVSL